MSVTDELPEPRGLWRRWVTLAAVLTATGHRGTWSVPGPAARHDDGGSWAQLVLVDGGRAVLYGCHRGHSTTADLLADAPGWLPWAELTGPELGFVLWHEHGRWHRVAGAPAGTDGLTSMLAAVLDDAAARAELIEFVFGRGEHARDTPAERADVAAAADRLLRAVSLETLRGLLGRLAISGVDLRAGLAVAVRAGEAPVPPAAAAGTRPARRTVRKLSDIEHDRLVWAAMRREPERERPLPVPTGELGALITWLRARAPAGDGRCSVMVCADERSMIVHQGAHPPREHPGEGRFGIFRELSELIRRLRAAEADDASGRWLFLSVGTTAEGFAVQRRYDSWPPWWQHTGESGPWRGHLRAEVEARAPGWRPGWTPLLAPEVAYRAAD
ncbi:hypothetical protein [Actinoplanes sp. N902-109]|uniref:hypothetical protein n=1 Tax=Actinoplanes sp. (strain N902-109) TaxID=649831 RepID=UPI000329455E|nr:hypothetical protein [Actinoplanes sp. N902-109]AGL19344.1 hypothetical protein L083_5834 [Actinoplanes sp. N902-109]